MEENSSLVAAKELISLMKIFYKKIFSYLSGVVDRISEFDLSKDVIIFGGFSMLGFYGLADVIFIFGVLFLVLFEIIISSSSSVFSCPINLCSS